MSHNLESQLARVRNILQNHHFCEIAGADFAPEELFDVRSIFKPRRPVTVSDFPNAEPEVGFGSTPDAEVLAVAIVDNLENPDENIILYLTEGSFYSEVEYHGDVSPLG